MSILSKRIGEKALDNYFESYKNINKSIEREEHLIFPQ
jgi:hypothetical protein